MPRTQDMTIFVLMTTMTTTDKQIALPLNCVCMRDHNDSISILPFTDFIMLPLDTYFLINWLDDPEGDDLYDVVNSKLVVPPDDVDILGVTPGTICKVAYGGSYYKAKVLQIGWYLSYDMVV